MVYSLSYTRPPFMGSSRNSSNGGSRTSLSGEEKQKSIDESIKSASSCSMCAGIPEPLSFDRIISGGTCPPCTLRDFMNYLKYIEHAAENLQFYLWLRQYTEKFAALPESERALSPEWKMTQAESDKLAASNTNRPMKVSADTAAALKGTGFDSTPRVTESEKPNPFGTPERTPSEDSDRTPPMSMVGSEDARSGWMSTFSANTDDTRKRAGDAYGEAGLKWKPFTIQPFRDEVQRIVGIYIADGGARQLNISGRQRAALLHALENTTHPSAFTGIATTVEWSLRCQAHPNFIRWTICNGNRPRVIFARGLGISLILFGILADLLITLSHVSRAWRVFPFVLYLLGIATLIAAWKGMCVVLHGLHHRHLRPWELFQDAEDASVETKGAGNRSMDSFDTYHSYETEPWVAKYEKRNILRKILDRQTWVEEPALRQIQDTIFLQAILAGIVGGAILTAIFVAVPKGNLI